MNFLAYLLEPADNLSTILGGAITILGVYLTIRYYSKNKIPDKIVSLNKIYVELDKRYKKMKFQEDMINVTSTITFHAEEGQEELRSEIENDNLFYELLYIAIYVDKDAYNTIANLQATYINNKLFLGTLPNNKKSDEYNNKIKSKVTEFAEVLNIARNEIKKQMHKYEKKI